MVKILYTTKELEEKERNSMASNTPAQPKKKLSFYQKVKKGAMKSRVGYERGKKKLQQEKRSWLYILGGKNAVIRNIERSKHKEKLLIENIRRDARRPKRKIVYRQERPQPIFGNIDFGVPQQNFNNQKRRKMR